MNKPSDEIIYNVLNGLATNEEAELVAKWFATEKGQQYLSESMNDYFFNIKEGFEEIYLPGNIPSDNIRKKIEKRTYTRKTNHLLLKIAAVLLPLILITGFTLQVTNQVDFTGTSTLVDVYVPKGEQKHIIFQDGTSVFLNSDSKLSYPEKFGFFSRKIKLDGEAYFKVEKDKRRPFIIDLNDASIKVLGTSFNVKAYSSEKDIKVSLDEGKVNLITSNKKNYSLLPQDVLVFNKQTNITTVSKNKQTSLDSQWKDSIITFDNTPLVEVMNILNRWYDVTFKVEEKEALAYSYTLTTEKTSLSEILQDFEKISPVQFILEKDTVKIRLK